MAVLRFSRKTLAFFALMALMLTGCETINDIGTRFSDFKFPEFWPIVESRPDVATGCPEAEVLQELRNLNEFAPMATPGPESQVSSVRIANLKTVCRSVDSTSVTLDLALTLTGSLGPKARIKPSDKPSFAYPYFVALTSGNGKIIAKEIHAVSLSYDKGQNRLTHEETLRHTLPVRLARGQAGPYRLLVGFQLSDEQLAYNRAHPEPKINVQDIASMVNAGPSVNSPASLHASEQKDMLQEAHAMNAVLPAAGESLVREKKRAISKPGQKPAHAPRPAATEESPEATR